MKSFPSGILPDLEPWMEDARSNLDSLSRRMPFFNVKSPQFNAVGDGLTDDTIPIQAALDEAAKIQGGGVVYLPSAVYLVEGDLTINSRVTILGDYAPAGRTNPSVQNFSGTVIKAGTTSTNPLITILGTATADGRIKGIAMRDIFFMGSDDFNAGNNRANRRCLDIRFVRGENSFINVFIQGFQQEAIHADEWWDSTMLGCRITWCGTEGVDPAVRLTQGSGGTDNVNAIKWVSCHFEQCAWILGTDTANHRHISFLGTKFEIGTGPEEITLGSPIQIGAATKEVYFGAGCQFIYRQADLWPVPSNQPYFFDIQNSLTTIEGCAFTSGPPNATIGAHWINTPTSLGGILSNNTFFYCYSPDFAISTNRNWTISNNRFWAETHSSGARNVLKIFRGNLVLGNTFQEDVSASPTSGALVQMTGNNNRVTSNTIIDKANIAFETTGSAAGNHVDGNDLLVDPTTEFTSGDFGQNHYKRLEPEVITTFADQSATPSVLGSPIFKTANTVATNITDFDDGSFGQIITIRFGDALTTIVHNASFIKLRGAVNFTGALDDIITLAHIGGVWMEVSRSPA